MNELMKWSQGNPGAMSFLSSLLSMENERESKMILQKIEEAKTLRGTNLWVLFSDLCGKDLDTVATLCENCPTEILEDACSRQDYSGRELVAEYK
jgi:hypothetical protein